MLKAKIKLRILAENTQQCFINNFLQTFAYRCFGVSFVVLILLL